MLVPSLFEQTIFSGYNIYLFNVLMIMLVSRHIAAFTDLQIQMNDVLAVEITHPLADLCEEVHTVSLCQGETLLGNSVKQLSSLQVLHQDDCL